ncbi:unannotated protein [freshwater metagenome]|uniref:Unannotated protein n=1 Tax=freshwater metagenome TaxID=449393 RepID=A0A6J6HTN7_9ZZZZ|nr:hypothetical protein [Actinomycetota bacterium]
MKTGIATTVSVVGVIAAGVAAFAVNSSVLGSSSPANSAMVSTAVAGNSQNGTAINNGQVTASDALATAVTDTTTTYQVGQAGSVVIDTSSGAIVVTGIAPAAGYTSEPARTEAGGIVKVHFVSATQRIEFTAQLVDDVVKTNVINEGNPSMGSVPPRPRHDDDDDHEEREEHDERDEHEDEDDD